MEAEAEAEAVEAAIKSTASTSLVASRNYTKSDHFIRTRLCRAVHPALSLHVLITGNKLHIDVHLFRFACSDQKSVVWA